ncbi:hypothetical protein GCM10010191_34100 [Actinomadura vinacea]|uniref:HEAT repeat domain-containing protein n=1 Tax=Actinomadura vinacea TaxID=115336 RepID=A0ABN3J3I1_9ACTN
MTRSLLVELLGLLPAYDPWALRDDPDTDLERIRGLVGMLVRSTDRTLVPDLERELERCVDSGDDIGRDAIGEVLAGIAGLGALPALLRASARDLGDDQDWFQTIICEDLLRADPEGARPAVLELLDATDPALRATAFWALDHVLTDDDLPRILAAADDPDPTVRETARHLRDRLSKGR